MKVEGNEGALDIFGIKAKAGAVNRSRSVSKPRRARLALQHATMLWCWQDIGTCMAPMMINITAAGCLSQQHKSAPPCMVHTIWRGPAADPAWAAQVRLAVGAALPPAAGAAAHHLCSAGCWTLHPCAAWYMRHESLHWT